MALSAACSLDSALLWNLCLIFAPCCDNISMLHYTRTVIVIFWSPTGLEMKQTGGLSKRR